MANYKIKNLCPEQKLCDAQSFLNAGSGNFKLNISNFNKRKTAFKDFLISSNVFKLGENRYQTQCSQYSKTFDLKGLFTYYKNNYHL